MILEPAGFLFLQFLLRIQKTKKCFYFLNSLFFLLFSFFFKVLPSVRGVLGVVQVVQDSHSPNDVQPRVGEKVY